MAASLRSTEWTGTLSSSPSHYNEARNRRATFTSRSLAPGDTGPHGPLSGRAACLAARSPLCQMGRTWLRSRSSAKVSFRRYLAVGAPFRGQTGVAAIEPVGNGGSAPDTRPSPSLGVGRAAALVGADGGSALAPQPSMADYGRLSRVASYHSRWASSVSRCSEGGPSQIGGEDRGAAGSPAGANTG